MSILKRALFLVLLACLPILGFAKEVKQVCVSPPFNCKFSYPSNQTTFGIGGLAAGCARSQTIIFSKPYKYASCVAVKVFTPEESALSEVEYLMVSGSNWHHSLTYGGNPGIRTYKIKPGNAVTSQLVDNKLLIYLVDPTHSTGICMKLICWGHDNPKPNL